MINCYIHRKSGIKRRLKEFKDKGNASNKGLFKELCFCILTPQSKAVRCDRALRELCRTGLLFSGSEKKIGKMLKRFVRFHNKKAVYLVGAQKRLTDKTGLGIKKRLNRSNIPETREWLVGNIKGLGYKEASHFLRNIGLGKDIAVLDRHILRNLEKLGVIKEIPSSIGRKNYLALEQKMREFSKKVKIPLEELDLLFWSAETGYIFK